MTIQFCCEGETPLVAVAVTMPPWPGESEAVLVDGPFGSGGLPSTGLR